MAGLCKNNGLRSSSVPTIMATAVKSRDKIVSATNSTSVSSRTNNVEATRLLKSEPSAPKSLPAVIFNAADDFINTFIDQPLRSSVDPRHVLVGNFYPVQECPPTECTAIDGQIPECLEGVYIRNGPNPRHLPRGGHHLFDGDGMLHAVRIKNGKVTFCSRFVQTGKFKQESKAGGALMLNVFSGMGGPAGIARMGVLAARVAFGLFDPFTAGGLANTSVVSFSNKIMAMAESDAPYIVRATDEGDIETVGRYDFDGKLFMGMTAHPKIDPETGELFAFRYGPIPPFLNLFRVAPDGTKSPDAGILSMVQPSFIHDFAITEKYAVFPDTQIVMKPFDILFGSPIGHDPAKVARIGFVPRYANTDSEMKWFDMPGFNFIHAINAWDEGDDEVVVIAPNTFPLEHALERTSLVHCTVEKLSFNMRTGVVTRRPLSVLNLEFGVINKRFTGRKNRFAYAAIGDPMPKVSGIVKLDFEKECVVGKRMLGDGVFGGEPFFVARNTDGAEDDGYVMTYTHDEGTGVSRFVVMDAQSESLEIVASIKLPARVPYGFHGLFVSESELSEQRA